MTALELALKSAQILDAKKATDLKALCIREISTLGDYFVVASGTSVPQVKAMADEIEYKLKQEGVTSKRIDGYQSGSWIVLDYYEVMIHLFTEDTRKFYSLEKLWGDAPELDLSDVINP